MYRIQSWHPECDLFDIPGVFAKEDCTYINISKEKLQDWISETSLLYDIMIVRAKDDFQTIDIFVDCQGKRFRQR